MSSIPSASQEEITRQLNKLTNASKLQRTGEYPALRKLGLETYVAAYDWLEAHGVRFEFDRVQEKYVEVQEKQE